MKQNLNASSYPAQSHRVQILDSEADFEARNDLNLLVSMEKARAEGIGVGCRGGGCGKCRIRVLEGTYDSKRMSRAWVSESDEAEGVVLACRIFPRSDLVVESKQLPLAEPYRPNPSSRLQNAAIK